MDPCTFGDAFDFELPAERIAQRPARPRDASRLLVLAREPRGESIGHSHFRALPDFLEPGDILVSNDTRVIPARLRGVKASTRGRVEVLLLAREGPGRWSALARGLGRAPAGTKLEFPEADSGEVLGAEILERRADASLLLGFTGPGAEDPTRFGEMPIPPYIRRGRADARDVEDYQTLFAAREGAVAAPTAGLHFTPHVLEALDARGVERVSVTLHVGWGTFEPLTRAALERGALHAERFAVSDASAAAVNRARAEGRRVIAVGTTSARALESAARPDGRIAPGPGATDLFIRPGHRFRAVDGLLTNFHLPRSSLLLLVCAFAGTERARAAYAEALRAGYRFYSYGDAMLIL